MKIQLLVVLAGLTTGAAPMATANAMTPGHLDNSVQTALNLGHAVGSASSCQDVSKSRVQVLTDRFAVAVNTVAASPAEAATIQQAFQQGMLNGRAKFTGIPVDCGTAQADFGHWERASMTLFPTAATVASASAVHASPSASMQMAEVPAQ